MSVALKTETKGLADQMAAMPTVRRITLANGTTIDHEVGPVYWVDRILLEAKAA